MLFFCGSKIWENQTLLIKAGNIFPPVQGQQQTAGWAPEKGSSNLLKLLIISAWVIPGIAESWVHECFGTHKSKADVSLTPPSIWITYIVQYPIWLPSVSHSSCCCSLRQPLSTNDTALNQSPLLKGSISISIVNSFEVNLGVRIWESEQSVSLRLLK